MSFVLSFPSLVRPATESGRLPRSASSPANRVPPSLAPSPRSASQGRHLVCNALIDAFHEHRNENADGYRSSPADRASFALAMRLAERLPSAVPDPEVGVDPDGEVSFDWFAAPRQTFSVSVGSDGILRYAALVGEQESAGRARFDGQTVPAIVVTLARRAMRHV